MTSYKNVVTVKYTQNPTDIVALREYILYEDEKQDAKFALLKFVNNLDQRLHGVKFEVMQYDAEEKLLAKTLAVYDKFTADANETFVPKAKLRLRSDCARISLKLIAAAFDRVRWEKGEFTDNSYTFDRYVHDVRAVPGQKAELPAEKPTVPQKPVPRKKQSNAFTVRDVYHKNVAKFPRVFNVLTMLMVLGFVVATAFVFRYTSSSLTVGDFDLLATSKTTATVCGYNGTAKELVIPSKVGDYNITRIAAGAFRKSSATSVTFESAALTLEGFAFDECSALQNVRSDGDIVLLANAFNQCKWLQTVDMPGATVMSGSLRGSLNIKYLDLGTCVAPKLADVFGEGTTAPVELSISTTRLTADFLDDMSIRALTIKNEDYAADFGAFKNVTQSDYERYDCVELYKGAVKTVKSGLSTLVLPTDVAEFETGRFATLLQSVETLVLHTDRLELNISFFSAFGGLKTLQISRERCIDTGTLSYCPATRFVSPVLSRPLKEYLADASHIQSIGVTGTATVEPGYFDDLPQITELTVDSGVTLSEPSLAPLTGLRTLRMPYGSATPLATYFDGIARLPLQSIEIIPLKNQTILPGGTFIGLTNVREIIIGDGFTRGGVNAVDDLPQLVSLTLPDTMTCSAGLIGDGCLSLTKVIGGTFNASIRYADFNRSATAAEAIDVRYTREKLPKNFFAGCDNLTKLRLTCQAIENGALYDCSNLRYLEIHSNTLGDRFADLFRKDDAESGAYLRALVLDTLSVPASYFADCIDNNLMIGSLYLLGATSVGDSALYGLSRLDSIYLPASLAYNRELYRRLGDVMVRALLFEGEAVSTSGLNASKYESYTFSYQEAQKDMDEWWNAAVL